MKSRFGMAIMLITHAMGVVAETAQRVVVMYAGKVVEEAPVDELFAQSAPPLHAGPDPLDPADRQGREARRGWRRSAAGAQPDRSAAGLSLRAALPFRNSPAPERWRRSGAGLLRNGAAARRGRVRRRVAPEACALFRACRNDRPAAARCRAQYGCRVIPGHRHLGKQCQILPDDLDAEAARAAAGDIESTDLSEKESCAPASG